MEPEPVRQFVSKAARCKAQAAFELCSGQPDARQRVRIPDLVCSLVQAAGDTAHRGDPPHRLATGLIGAIALFFRPFVAHSTFIAMLPGRPPRPLLQRATTCPPSAVRIAQAARSRVVVSQRWDQHAREPFTASYESIAPATARSHNQFTSPFMIGRTTLRSGSPSGSGKGRFISER